MEGGYWYNHHQKYTYNLFRTIQSIWNKGKNYHASDISKFVPNGFAEQTQEKNSENCVVISTMNWRNGLSMSDHLHYIAIKENLISIHHKKHPPIFQLHRCLHQLLLSFYVNLYIGITFAYLSIFFQIALLLNRTSYDHFQDDWLSINHAKMVLTRVKNGMILTHVP